MSSRPSKSCGHDWKHHNLSRSLLKRRFCKICGLEQKEIIIGPETTAPWSPPFPPPRSEWVDAIPLDLLSRIRQYKLKNKKPLKWLKKDPIIKYHYRSEEEYPRQYVFGAIINLMDNESLLSDSLSLDNETSIQIRVFEKNKLLFVKERMTAPWPSEKVKFFDLLQSVFYYIFQIQHKNISTLRFYGEVTAAKILDPEVRTVHKLLLTKDLLTSLPDHRLPMFSLLPPNISPVTNRFDLLDV